MNKDEENKFTLLGMAFGMGLTSLIGIFFTIGLLLPNTNKTGGFFIFGLTLALSYGAMLYLQ